MESTDFVASRAAWLPNGGATPPHVAGGFLDRWKASAHLTAVVRQAGSQLSQCDSPYNNTALGLNDSHRYPRSRRKRKAAPRAHDGLLPRPNAQAKRQALTVAGYCAPSFVSRIFLNFVGWRGRTPRRLSLL